ncbi:two-component regulator propeller domain-containing protein [Candidatus Poribacteria bacterium]
MQNKLLKWIYPQSLTALLFLCFILLFGITNANGEQQEPGEVLIGNELRDIEMDADHVWIATEKGVNRYDRKTDEWKFFTIANGLVNNQVNCIAPERIEGILAQKSGDEVWFGTDSGVSVYYKETGLWRTFTKKDGLIQNKVNAISARGRDIWIATDKGVSVYDKKKDTWMSYTKFPGISTSEVTSVYHQSSYAWIGTQRGVARYNYTYKKWEYFTTGGSMWYSPEGGTRETDDSPIPDNRINSIDGEARYIYIATKSTLVEFDSRASTNYLTERRAYSALGRGRRAAGNMLYTRRIRPRQLLQMSRDRKEKWEELGWKHMDLSSLVGGKRHEVSDNFLDVKYRSGEAWVATSRGLARFDSWLGERQIFTKENGLIDDEVMTLATIGGEVWAGTAHGLGRYNTFRRSWKNYRMEKALPSSFITALSEDKGGMWFATRGAVSSLDNKTERWKTFTRKEGLAGANIKSIAVVGNYVWFGTDEGVSRLNKATKEWDNFNASRTGLVDNDVTAILVDGKYIWVGTKSGLNRYDDTTGQWATYSTSFGLLDNSINSLAADPKYVWIGTRAGLNRYDKIADRWTSYTTADGLSNNVITSLALDSERVWAATKSGLNMLDRKTEKWASYTNKRINAIALQDGDKVWMGSRASISRYDLTTDSVHEFTDADAEGLSRVNVYGAQDTPQYVWFATDGGIFRYNKLDGTWWVYSPTKQRGSTDTLADGNVQAIVGDKDYIYFATAAGISRYDRMTGNWLNYTTDDGLIGPNVRALLLNGPDLWAGTQEGISRYDTVSDAWSSYTRKDGLPSNSVFSLAMENGNIWAGTHGGAAYQEKGKSGWHKLTKTDGLPDDHVWDIAVDEPYLWFGTNDGVGKYNPADDVWVTYKVDDGLMSNVVLSIGFEDKYIFLNTPGGVSIYDKELDSFTPFSQADGLAGRTATSIGSSLPTTRESSPQPVKELQQEVWIGTYGGVTRYDLVTDTARNTTAEDGLASNKVQAIRMDGKYIWFGTDSGLSRYNRLTDEWITFGKAATSKREEQSSGLISYNIKSLGVDDSYLWVGTRSGLSRYDKVSDEWKHFPMVQSRPDDVPQQSTGSGATQVAQEMFGEIIPEKKTSLLSGSGAAPSTATPSIRAIVVAGKYLWLGSDVGLFVYDRTVDSVAWFTSEVKNIRNIRVHKDKIWVISDDQIAMFERGSTYDSWTVFTDSSVDEEVTSDTGSLATKERDLDEGAGLLNLTSAIVDGDRVWLGRENGLRIYNTKKRKPDKSIPIPAELSEKKITAIAMDGRYLWVGTREGLHRRNRQTGVWKVFTKSYGLASDYVSCLAVGDQKIWVGSSDRGVSAYDRNSGQWRTFAAQDGLVDNNVRAIAVDGKYVWFGTFSGGVCRYDKASDLWTTYRTENYSGRPQI